MKHLNLKLNRFILFVALTGVVFSCGVPPETDPGDPDNPDGSGIAVNEIQEFNETPSGQEEAARLGQSFPASDFTPSGFYLPPGTDLMVKMEQLEQGSGTPVLLIGSYSRYEAKWNPAEVQLHKGINTIKGDEYGGLLYVRYNAKSNNVSSGRVRLEFMNGHEPLPYFVLGETTNGQWQTMLDTWTEAPDVQLVSDKAIIVASRDKALQYRDDDQNQLLTLVDEVLKTEDDISGLDGSAPEHQRNVHRILMTETDKDDTFMAATWYRTWYHRDVANHILTVEGLGNNGWGPWHELGHMHQQSAWTWDTLGEVTVNIYALAAERAMGVSPSRLVRDGVWYAVADYLALSDEERDFNSNAAGLFVRLAMFQQLWLAYGDEFFQELHKHTREEQPSLSSREEKMRYFMLKACEISGNDLAEFFRKWGLKASASVYDEIAALNLPQPDIDLTTLTDDPDWDSRWLVTDYSSQETAGENGRASNIIDGDPATYWHTRWFDNAAEYPHYVTVDMKESAAVGGFTLTQRDGQRKVKDLEIQVSNDNQDWESLGDFVLEDNATPQNIDLAESRSFRYFKLIMKSAHDGLQFAAMAEVAVY
ncbi:M60 family metallopeptidase [Sinomicrobium weinanense]|uniref:Discoidin domain-containing protein n=1 Tax=Sinomicrobium weinanense TaxID=2842200 RepID=A0A926JSG6_9FLAO|nr:M60 family metallopeptidase [Sinomicrobium weinanense]MBC9796561.1 discoidin domain-containing protein [Sinomicrobium weinanense]MBU3123052.1 M60 family metallopeptidase [Sinomicrobium weinanense]